MYEIKADPSEFKQGSVPPGKYPCEVVYIKVSRGNYGNRTVQIRVRITDGPQRGMVVTRFGPENDPEMRRLVGKILGRALDAGENLGSSRLRAGLKGRKGLVTVVGGVGGRYTIGNFELDANTEEEAE